MQTTLARHLEGVVVAKVPIQHQISQGKEAAHQTQQCLYHALDASQLLGQCHLSLVLVLAAFGASWLTLRFSGLALGSLLPGLSGSFLGLALDHLLHTYGIRATLLGTNKRQGEEGQTGHRFAVQTREEPVQTVSAPSRLGHHTFVPGHHIDVFGVEQLGSE